ncbi:MAG TPA: hypothetical protein VN634_21950 [Candidatus Limnocylindrales bacterium]|nr:hypothetical protein [Candidatus Limnocylindrales bacterium]
MPAIDGLRSRLTQLPLRIDRASVVFSNVALESYPDGSRPSSTVTLSGGDHAGRGEHVGWTDEDHASFGKAVSTVPTGKFRLGEWTSRLAGFPAYDRAALEAAAIDLALAQHGTSLFELCDVEPPPVRYAISFAAVADPVAEARSLGAGTLPLKIDADPAWKDETWSALAALGTVAVIDFKLLGEAADHERACRYLPDAWIEDPRPGAGAWSPQLVARLSADAAVTSVHALEALEPAPAAINVKPARIGSVLEAIDCLSRAAQRNLQTYIGGMFEVGIGRSQLLALAALACPDGPNDIAPLLPLVAGGARPQRLVAESGRPGFGGESGGPGFGAASGAAT